MQENNIWCQWLYSVFATFTCSTWLTERQYWQVDKNTLYLDIDKYHLFWSSIQILIKSTSCSFNMALNNAKSATPSYIIYHGHNYTTCLPFSSLTSALWFHTINIDWRKEKYLFSRYFYPVNFKWIKQSVKWSWLQTNANKLVKRKLPNPNL